MDSKALQFFAGVNRKDTRLSEDTWLLTTSKRTSQVIPEGVKVFDSDQNKMYVGDGSIQGGNPIDQKSRIRIIAINAAASGTLTAATSGSTNTITWPEGGAYLRTGDAITLAAGTGTLPSGVTAGSYYIHKKDDIGSGEQNTGTSFEVCSTRANALAGTSVSILSSGVAGWTCVISGFAPQACDNITLIDPVSAAVDVFLPDANAIADGSNFTIKRAKTATNYVTVKEVDASGNVSASGSVTIDDTAGYVLLKAATDDYLDLYSVASTGEYWTLSKQVTA